MKTKTKKIDQRTLDELLQVFTETEEETIAALQIAEEQIERGEGVDAEIVFREFRKMYGYENV